MSWSHPRPGFFGCLKNNCVLWRTIAWDPQQRRGTGLEEPRSSRELSGTGRWTIYLVTPPLICLQFPHHTPSKHVLGTQGRRDMQAWTEVEATRECCLLTCSTWLALLAFLTPRTTQAATPTVTWVCSYWSLIKKMSQRLVHMPVLQFLK